MRKKQETERPEHRTEQKAGLELIESCPDVVVSTLGEDGIPQMRVMFNLRGRVRYPELLPLYESRRDDFLVYLGTNTSSAKIDQIRRRPEASLLFARPEAYHSLMLAGHLEIVDDPDIRQALWRPGWERYYPAGVEDPDYTVLRFRAVYAKGWHHSRNYSFRIGERP